MLKRRVFLVAVVTLFAVVVGLLAFMGVIFGSNWSTFIPDLIIGVAGAGVIAVLISQSDRRHQARREKESSISSAYERLIDALTPVKGIRFDENLDLESFNVLVTRMIQLSDWKADDQPELAIWLEAERQLALSRMTDTSEKTLALGDAWTADEWLVAQHPFQSWINELANNLRFWRTGKLSSEQMIASARAAEELLRHQNRWRSDPMPWRAKS